ncbi:MAG: pantetheine-phosphate adenylyltransferase [Demequina sp.]|uniref:pantetheine-phosphate adenylyltransferase n=1 Tax=Demequina sp. TaxID=2050685 RepID=UPI003A8978C5
MTIAVLPGTYDPITVGHIDIVRRASRLFDEVIVAVAHNATKAPLLGADERVRLAAQAVAEIPGARAVRTDGLIVDFCRTVGADALVKGLRGGADFDAERPMALMNRSLSGIETVFVVGDNALSHVASSLVRDVARHGGDVSAYVPEGVSEAITAALARA